MSCIFFDTTHYQFIANSLDAVCHKYSEAFNLRAYDERYPSEYDPDFFPDFISEVQGLKWDDLNICQLLKACECIHYQCSDSKDWKGSDASEMLDIIMDDCKTFLISNLPDYQASKWCLED